MNEDTLVRCKVCGHEEKVSFAYCLGHGWPRHCGKQMPMIKTDADIDKAVGGAIAEQLPGRKEAAR